MQTVDSDDREAMGCPRGPILEPRRTGLDHYKCFRKAMGAGGEWRQGGQEQVVKGLYAHGCLRTITLET